jgi:hypothetical protein
MVTMKVELDAESFKKLAKLSVEERRPMNLQAEVLILQGLGRWPLPMPPWTPAEDTADVSA